MEGNCPTPLKAMNLSEPNVETPTQNQSQTQSQIYSHTKWNKSLKPRKKKTPPSIASNPTPEYKD